jgi:high frequency lysogenization protein
MTNRPHKSLHGQTLALAGLYQVAHLVQQTARGRMRDALATETSLGSIFITAPDDVEAVYNGHAGLATGLAIMVEQLGNAGSTRDLELTGYVITLMHLERKLSAQPALLDRIARAIDALREADGRAPALSTELTGALAAIYADTISTLTPRIMVKGEPVILDSPDNRDMVRALLLAGIRAAVLWRQCGGGRIRMVLGRKALLQHARSLATGA